MPSIASKGRGATFNGARAKLKIVMGEDKKEEKRIMLSEFHAQSILAANIKLEYKGNTYQLRGDHVFENFQITGMQYDLTNKALEIGTINWENWQGQELWHNMHVLKGVETGKGVIQWVYKVVPETHEKVGGYAFDIQDLEMNKGAYQNVELDAEKNKTKHHQIEVEAEGKSTISGVYYEDEELYFSFQMPDGKLSLPFVHYEDGSWNIIRTLDRYPVTLENPRVELLKKKDGTIILQRMNIDQLTARRLKASINGNQLKIPSTAYASIKEVGGNYEDSLFDNIKDSDFCLLILISFTLPILFFTITFFVKKPIKWCIKITYLVITIGMFFIYLIYSFVIEFASIIKTNLTPSYPYVIGYVNLVFIITFWCLLLATPLSKYKFFNWPFEQREVKESKESDDIEYN